ncbi:MAG TPA: electron transfer flavoprotein subunit beta/FixA family protein [Nocardioides sp.]|jgi:electron transfer flavoprotein beta subunit|uniref:electron transfer flavoprotein subunit beta/FixA family protein n=1 Tax=Nocardioides sp. TaxID=35761 RepID=UPI002E368923|nr:electron transfer flavoprotein subunit beta/FixA family protein [Nocardioides sp.]HEX3929785.1 electron transfer flavoprotein subunit beta/FixA family protein [Nocardioides sp.]
MAAAPGVLVCVKRVPDITEEVVLSEDGQSVDGRRSGFTMSAHEECAVELAVQVTAASGGESTVLTLGDAEAVEQLRNALAVGCRAATHVLGEPFAFGPSDVAREIAAVVRAHEESGRSHDLVLLGNDAADSGDFQVGIRLAYELGRPVVNGAKTVTIEESPEGPVVVAVGEGPDGQETYRVPLPAVVTIREGGVEPRYPSVPGRLKAKKIPIEEREPVAAPSGAGRVRMVLPPPTPSAVQILGEGPEAAGAVVDLLEKLGVLTPGKAAP